jgi:hypothetical protein
MFRTLSLAAVAVVVVGAVAGCAKKAPSMPEQENVTVVVDNQNFYDATVYLRWYGERRRLGSVTGFTQKEFETRWVAPELQVEIDLLAGGTYRGDRVAVSPGEIVEVELPPNLDRIHTGVGSSFSTFISN